VSFLFFGWLTPLILERSQRVLKLEDLYSIPPDMMSRRNYSKWSVLWKKELRSSGYTPGEGSCRVSRSLPSLFRSLRKAYGKPVTVACILALLRAMLKVIPALSLHLLMSYMVGNDPMWKGMLYALGLVGANFGSGMLAVHIDRILTLTGLNVKSVMMAAVYRKALRLSSESQRDYTLGELVNLISVDADRIIKLSLAFGYVACGIPVILFVMVVLWQYLGVACLAGVAVMLVLM
ncbi:unnamed protein product, partial [Ixodes hexagonus]